MRVNYRVPVLQGFYKVNAFIDETTVELTCPLPGTEIRYTTDGSMPTKESNIQCASLSESIQPRDSPAHPRYISSVPAITARLHTDHTQVFSLLNSDPAHNRNRNIHSDKQSLSAFVQLP